MDLDWTNTCYINPKNALVSKNVIFKIIEVTERYAPVTQYSLYDLISFNLGRIALTEYLVDKTHLPL